jgi:predicted MFS family arabinose efflux permease
MSEAPLWRKCFHSAFTFADLADGMYRIYSAALSAGVGCGIVVSGLITINLHWRYIYWVSGALVGACTLLIILTFPETEYNREKMIGIRFCSVHQWVSRV